MRALTGTLCSLLQIVPLDAGMHAKGLRLCERHGFSVYDGMIVAAALEAGCGVLWSEDMRIENLVGDTGIEPVTR